MLRSGCGAAAESKGENIRDMKWRPADRRTGGRAKRIRTRKVKQEDASKYGNGPSFRRARRRGQMWRDSGVGPVRRGIRQWRNRVLHRWKGECRVCRVEARIP